MNIDKVSDYLSQLQNDACARFQALDGGQFKEDPWQHAGGGGGNSRVLENGAVFEKAGVNFSRIRGDQLPAAALAKRTEWSGNRFEAVGISIVLHPQNPYVPTAHCNLRFFVLHSDDGEPKWWFGGGYDLTPYYPFAEDVIAWHRAAHAACSTFGADVYPEFKHWCDKYFYLHHRNETRGIGGIFFDDLNRWGFDCTFDFIRAVGESFVNAYGDIVSRRRDTEYGDRERAFQLYRRGRYVEFNLVYDRGTLFGLQSGGRCESILMSLPPQVKWQYGWEPEPGTAEHALYRDYLKPRDWLGPEQD